MIVYEQLEKARLLILTGRVEHALRMLAGVLAKEPNNVFAHYLAGHCYLQLDRISDAGAASSSSCALEPENSAYLLFRAEVLRYSGLWKWAMQVAEQSRRIAPSSAEPYYLMGAIASDMGDQTGAKDFLNRALKLDPEHLRSLSLTASILGAQSNFEAARSASSRALSIEPSNARSLSIKAWNDFVSGSRTDHRAAFKVALTKDPNGTLAKDGPLRSIVPFPSLQAWRIRTERTKRAFPTDPWCVLYPFSIGTLMIAWLPAAAAHGNNPAHIVLAPIIWLIGKGLAERIIPDALLSLALLSPAGKGLISLRSSWKLVSKAWIQLICSAFFFMKLDNDGSSAIAIGAIIVIFNVLDESNRGPVTGWPVMVRMTTVFIWGLMISLLVKVPNSIDPWLLAFLASAIPWIMLYSERYED